MNSMSGKTVVNTNVLIYSHDVDAGRKHEIAKKLIGELWKEREGFLSMQVLQEFYVMLMSGAGSPVPRRAARDLLQAYSVWPIVSLDAADLDAASDVEERHRLSFRDALIVVAARKSGAALLLAEHIQPYRAITGLDVRNPFA